MDALVDLDIELLTLSATQEEVSAVDIVPNGSEVVETHRNQNGENFLSAFYINEIEAPLLTTTSNLMPRDMADWLEVFLNPSSAYEIVAAISTKSASAESLPVNGEDEEDDGDDSDDDPEEIIDEIIVNDGLDPDDDDYDYEYEPEDFDDLLDVDDDDLLDDDEEDEGSEDDDETWAEVSTKTAQSLGLLSDVINIASVIVLPGDKAQLERLSASLDAISIALASGEILTKETLIETLGAAYSIALNGLSNAAIIGTFGGLGTVFGAGPQTGAITATIGAFTVFLADATGVSEDYYDRAGGILAELTYNLITGDDQSILDDLAELQQAIIDGIREFNDDPESFLDDISGNPVPNIDPFGDDETQNDDYYEDP